MMSLRASIASLGRFDSKSAVNISDVYKYLTMERPVSLNDLTARIASLPNSVPFHSTIVTGAAMGGEVSIVLNRDGSYRFSGFMRATGLPSFSFRVGAVLRSPTGQVTIAAQRSGKVFGTDTPGDRQYNWDEPIDDPKTASLLRALWPDISGSQMVVSRSSELSGVVGTAVDVVKDIAEFYTVAQTLGGNLAICLIIGSELGEMGVDVPGMGGVVGIGIVGGSLFIWGPLSIGPAFVLGVAAGAVVDAMVKIRRVTPQEQDFARQVFGDSLDFERIRITNFVGLGGRAFTLPTVDDHILVNIGVSDAMYDAPVATTYKSNIAGQLLIHELTHAWQIQHAPLSGGYVPGWLCEEIGEQVHLGSAAYDYGPPGPEWSSFHFEAQAHIVDQWFAAAGPQGPLSPLVRGVPKQMDPDGPYFGYIDNNIRAGAA